MIHVRKGKEVWEDFKIITAVRPKDTVMAVGGSVLVAGAWFLIQFVNSCLLRTVAGLNEMRQSIWAPLVFLCGLYCVARIPTILGYRISGYCAERIVGTANQNLLRTWLYSSHENRRQVASGKVLSLLLNDSGSVLSDFLFMGFTINFVEPFLLGILSMLVFVFWKPVVLVPFLLLGLPSILLNYFFQRKIQSYSVEERETFDELTGFFQYLTEQLVSIRESGIYTLFLQKSSHVASLAVTAEKRKENTIRYARFVSDLLEDFGLLSSVLLCIFLASRQHIEMADLAFIFAFSPFIFRFFNCFTNTWNYLTDVHTSVRRVKEVTKKEAEEKPKDPLLHLEGKAGEIQVRNVSFAYGEQEPVLKDVSFSVPFHERHILSGMNGAGKSTLMKIFLGDLIPQTGEISIVVGEEIYPCPQKFFTYIPQEPELLNISFRENMILDCYRFGEEPESARVEEIAKMLHLHELIVSFPEKYETVVVENGKNLSLGEKQKISLARALLSPAPCILLDEPEHGLDKETVRAFFDYVAQSGKTIIMISHSKENLAFFDIIQTLDNGRIKSTAHTSRTFKDNT